MHLRLVTDLRTLAFLCAALATSGCAMDAQKLAATSTGDLSNPPAPRGSSTALLVEQCGQGGLTDLGGRIIARKPYLQNSTDHSASLLFTTAEPPTTRYDVTVTLPDGQLVMRVPSEPDAADPSGRQQRAHLANLQPNQVYCYALTGLTAPIGFRTAPEPGAELPVRFAVLGDSGGGGSVQRAVRDQLSTVPMDLMLHTGDIAYGKGSLSQLERSFFGVYEELLGSIPIFPITGNHDYETQEASPFRQVFEVPGNAQEGSGERWYSFDWGSVHFVALDTERVGKTQIDWLESDLGKNQLPWTVVYMHKPPYSSGWHGSAKKVRKAFSPLFEGHGVQLVLAGHDHDYERTRPIRGVTYVVTGGGGKSTRSVGHSGFTAFSEDALHFVFGQVRDNEMILHAIDGVGREFDSVLIPQFPDGEAV